jgi:hypothetical protein
LKSAVLLFALLVAGAAPSAGGVVASASPAGAPGSLPQTNARPSASTAAFAVEMADLFQGVVHNSPRDALPAFFPEGAYVQVKAIADARSDWSSRLVGEYAQDLSAAHALLGSAPAGDRLEEVLVPAANAHWIPPGVCLNRVGYWEVANARVVYLQAGHTRSFGIASLISWRGVWYVVHLGAILRSGAGGQVDAPAAGTGASAPSSTC